MMKFDLITSGYSYRPGKTEKLEKLGFKFKEEIQPAHRYYKLHDQELYIDFNNLDELLRFIREYGEVIIIPPEKDGWEWTIEIYDDYRE